MRSARLSLALDTGAIVLPATGPIAVFGPRAGDDLSALPKDRLAVVTTFRPDYDAFERAGYAVSTDPAGPYAAALVCLPRARAAARAQIAAAAAQLPEGAPIVVDGQKTDGVDACLKEVRKRIEVGEAVAKAHGKLFAFASPGAAAFADWAARPQILEGGFQTLPGVFSADGIDKGSALLAGALPRKLPRRIADLGAGWGYLARAILAREGVEELHLVEADKAALDCARVNVTDPRARFHWADATTFRLPGPVDAVVTNPPFHTTRAAEPALGTAFLRTAAAMLTPSGDLWLVANRHLPYERDLAEIFRDVTEIAGNSGFKVLHAHRPLPPSRPRR
ncbi:class I SAM-dependent methyltransferase [Acidimangrovimonas pyrenivorans]|uniref:Class I SAM-dependent methyltransferase n=1 Tax=Acidimangrovimonas pyrenivorans TaxID=2030798 RepID=A0ABV7ALM1_9RHOB